MAEYEASRVLPAPAQQVFEVATDPGRLGRWLPVADTVELDGPDHVRLDGERGGLFRAQPDQLRAEWGDEAHADRPSVYAGWLQVYDRDDTSSEVNVHLSFFDERQQDGDRGIGDALAALGREVEREIGAGR